MGNKKLISLIIGMIIVFVVIYLMPSHGEKSGDISILIESEDRDFINNLVDEFLEKNTKVKVKLVTVDEVDEDFVPDLQFTSKDIELNNNNDYNMSIMESYRNNFTKQRVKQNEVDGKLGGIPFTSNPIALFIRDDLLKQFDYTTEDINSFEKLISVGIDIYNKTSGNVRIFSYKDSLNIRYILNKQSNLMTPEEVEQFIESELVSSYGDDNYLFRLGSIEVVKEIKDGVSVGEWICTYPYSVNRGENRFYQSGGKNIIVYKNPKQDEDIVKKFITFCLLASKTVDNYFTSGDIFPSAISKYENNDLENQVSNFKNDNPFVILTNISLKAPVE